VKLEPLKVNFLKASFLFDLQQEEVSDSSLATFAICDDTYGIKGASKEG
jgi:hypothetical protein